MLPQMHRSVGFRVVGEDPHERKTVSKICECLAYDDGSVYLCEACGPRWLEHERSLSERAPVTPLSEARREAEALLTKPIFFTEMLAPWVSALRSLLAATSDLEALLRECNAVCLCGCPGGDHEADECGESCGNDEHECIRVAPAVLAYVNGLRSRPAPVLSPEVREAALHLATWTFDDHDTSDGKGVCCGGCVDCATQRLLNALAAFDAAAGGSR